MADVFSAYKPLRNHLREVPLTRSIGVIRGYLQHLQFNEKLPTDIQVIPKFLSAKHKVEKGVYEWELEILAREIIINSPDSDYFAFPKDLRRWDHFSGAVNKLKDLENEVAKLYGKENVLLELFRLAHRQFPWQVRPNGIWINRYYKIFSHPQLDSILQRVIGLNAQELYTFGLALTGTYLNWFALHYPATIQIGNIDAKKFDLLLPHFATDMNTMRKLMTQSQQINDTYVYALNPLRKFPLIRMVFNGRDSLICPVPTYLFWRFTSGIYYDLCKEADFSAPFGESFQGYVGDVMKRATASASSLTVLPEENFKDGKERKATVDWRLDAKDAALFVEVKTKRLRIEAKTELFNTDVLKEELGKVADMIVQIYSTIRDYRNGLYPNYKYDAKKQIFPLLLTLEDLYLFGPTIENELRASIVKKFKERNLDEAWLETMPYSVCCIEEFERMMQVIATVGIAPFVGKKVFDKEKSKWQFASFMNSDFAEEFSKTKDLFPEVMQQINPGIGLNRGV